MDKEKDNMPLVTIGVPLYNHEVFIQDCLDSILADSYPNKEIIVLDDGSTDRSLSVVRQWIAKNDNSQKGIKLISRTNRGLCKTLNEMIAMAQGEFICLVASDDYLLDGGIQRRVEYLEKNSEKLAVFSDCFVVDELGNVISNSGISEFYNGRKKCLKDEHFLKYELIFRWCIPGPVLLARKRLYEKVGYYDERLMVEDWDFYLRMLKCNVLGFLDEKVAKYRIHGTNTCIGITSKSEKYLKSQILTIEKNFQSFNRLQRMRLLARKNILANLSKGDTSAFLFGKLVSFITRILYEIFLMRLHVTELKNICIIKQKEARIR